MCGIAGYVDVAGSEQADESTLVAMCNAMRHRGPDDQGIFVDGKVGLGMRRLSIIDLDTGHQPISNETKTVWVVLNGEIYNYRELAQWLKAKGHSFQTASDTEVIVHLYEEFGEDCVHKLRGMFAFAIWDLEAQRLFIARDRLGVKPLYYGWNGKHFIFGSELKVLLAHPSIERALDPQALLYYLRYSYIPDPLTIFQGISRLMPGHLLNLRGSNIEVKCYWDGAIPPDEPTSMSEEDAVNSLEQQLKEAVRLRLVSDVPLGAFLSGGVDSSLVVGLMSREMARPVTTFSIGFEEEAYNELPHARAVAQHLNTEHHEFIVGPQDCGLIEEIVRHFDEPFGDPSAIPTYCLSKLAAKHVTVALSGDGGDELFAGYDRYRVDLDRRRYDKWPTFAKRGLSFASDLLSEGCVGKNLLHAMSLQGHDRYLESVSYVRPNDLTRMVTPDVIEMSHDRTADCIMREHLSKVSGRPWLAQLQYLDTKTYLPGDVMTKVDRMSMAHSLEAREPLLDHVLVEFAARLPTEMKFRHGIPKYLLKKVAERYLPTANIHRKKQGFGVPLEYWFKGDLKDYMHDMLLDRRARERGLIAPGKVAELIRRYESGRMELATSIWMLVILETWCRIYLDQKPTQSAATVQCAASRSFAKRDMLR
jgi:asparagine synthase (glutamine-hydrolysing)